MENGEIIEGGIIPQTHKTIANLLLILAEAGYGPEHIVRVGVWLDDPRDFWTFNKIYQSYFSEHPPARACVRASMMVDCKVEIDCIACRETAQGREWHRKEGGHKVRIVCRIAALPRFQVASAGRPAIS